MNRGAGLIALHKASAAVLIAPAVCFGLLLVIDSTALQCRWLLD